MSVSQSKFKAAPLVEAVAAIFKACGVAADAAVVAADDLVAADVEGVASHGVMLVPMYIKRLRAGSISTAATGQIVSDSGTAVVIDAQNVLGQLTARQAVAVAVERAKKFGMSTVAVRNAFHFGTAGRYARLMADQGMVGIVLSNTRPLMPAPGGAEALTGNNPLAIAVPSAGEYSPEVDMALSAVAMGKIRNAAASGSAIPEGWATDKEGASTTDPQKAIEGMLLPAGGPKGFGLAFMIDLLAGGLSGGSIGAEVNALYGDAAKPYGCSNLFIAIDVGHFTPLDQFRARAASETTRVSNTRRAAGVEKVFAPGELAHVAKLSASGTANISPAAWAGLLDTGKLVGIDINSFFE